VVGEEPLVNEAQKQRASHERVSCVAIIASTESSISQPGVTVIPSIRLVNVGLLSSSSTLT